jgi:hypothetical protein
MSAIVESVETASQVEIVRSFNADAAQGFFFARPMSSEDAAQFASGAEVAQFSLTRSATLVKPHAGPSALDVAGESAPSDAGDDVAEGSGGASDSGAVSGDDQLAGDDEPSGERQLSGEGPVSDVAPGVGPVTPGADGRHLEEAHGTDGTSAIDGEGETADDGVTDRDPVTDGKSGVVDDGAGGNFPSRGDSGIPGITGSRSTQDQAGVVENADPGVEPALVDDPEFRARTA